MREKCQMAKVFNILYFKDLRYRFSRMPSQFRKSSFKIENGRALIIA